MDRGNNPAVEITSFFVDDVTVYLLEGQCKTYCAASVGVLFCIAACARGVVMAVTCARWYDKNGGVVVRQSGVVR